MNFSLRAPAVAAMLLALVLPAVAGQQRGPRIVSLVPSLTEDLFAIGAGAQVVGTSQFTDFPPAATRVPQVSSASSLDAERIVALHPDIVVGIPSQSALVADLRRAGVRIVLMSDDSFVDIFADLKMLGSISGHSTQAAALAVKLLARTHQIVRAIHRGERHAPRCFVVLGVAPIFTVGDRSYIAHLIEMAGGRNAADDLRVPYGRYSAEVLFAHQPDVLIGDPQGGLSGVLGQAPWNALRAVREHRVYILQNAAILERPGPRYNEGLEWLIARLHSHAS